MIKWNNNQFIEKILTVEKVLQIRDSHLCDGCLNYSILLRVYVFNNLKSKQFVVIWFKSFELFKLNTKHFKQITSLYLSAIKAPIDTPIYVWPLRPKNSTQTTYWSKNGDLIRNREKHRIEVFFILNNLYLFKTQEFAIVVCGK